MSLSCETTQQFVLSLFGGDAALEAAALARLNESRGVRLQSVEHHLLAMIGDVLQETADEDQVMHEEEDEDEDEDDKDEEEEDADEEDDASEEEGENESDDDNGDEAPPHASTASSLRLRFRDGALCLVTE